MRETRRLYYYGGWWPSDTSRAKLQKALHVRAIQGFLLEILPNSKTSLGIFDLEIFFPLHMSLCESYVKHAAGVPQGHDYRASRYHTVPQASGSVSSFRLFDPQKRCNIPIILPLQSAEAMQSQLSQSWSAVKTPSVTA